VHDGGVCGETVVGGMTVARDRVHRQPKKSVMLRKIASVVFLLDSVLIGLGAFGHGSQPRHVQAIDQFPIEADIHSMIYVVWYFLGGCMLTFGVTLVWVWHRVRIGDARPIVVAALIGVLYVGIGGFGLLYRHGDPFMALFVMLGAVLLACGAILVRSGHASVT
jgi:hypothetical protein